jgi:hypothetical protein
MSFLTDDARAALELRFNELQKDNVPEVQEETRVEPRAEETSFQNKTDVKADKFKSDVEVPSTNDKEEQGHSVPYQRFKEVNESKKALKMRTAELEKQLSEARSQLESGRKVETSKQNDDNTPFKEFDDFYKSVMEEDAPSEKYTSLEKRLQTFEQRAAQAELEAEIAGVTRKYPDVPESVLLQACIQNPDVSLADVAKEYSQFIAEIEERALAKHSKKAPAAPPRHHSSSSSQTSAPSNKPRTFSDARAAASAYLKQQGL